MSSSLEPRIPSESGEPAWEAAILLPNQGEWNEADFLSLHTNRMAELADGRLEVLPRPTWLHQLIVVFFLEAIKNHLRSNEIGGVVLFAPLPVRLFPGTIREPDILYVAPENLPKPPTDYPERVDLVVEVVSAGADARKRDYENKRKDYAKAMVSEYWIVDPEQGQITVLGLMGQEYETLGVFRPGEVAHSRYLPGLSIEVADVFALADQNPGFNQ